jgi:hypothetical protein
VNNVKYRIGVFATLLLASSRPGIALPQDQAKKITMSEAASTNQKKSGSTVSIKLKIFAEGKPSLPSGSRIAWQGVEDRCRNVTGNKYLELDGTTTVNLPVCKTRLTLFVTGFSTQAVVVDVATNTRKYKEQLRIAIRHQGAAEVVW